MFFLTQICKIVLKKGLILNDFRTLITKHYYDTQGANIYKHNFIKYIKAK